MAVLNEKQILIIDSYCSLDELQFRKKKYLGLADYGVMMLHRARWEKHALRILFNFGVRHPVFEKALRNSQIDLRRYKLIIVNELGRDPISFIRYIRKYNPTCHLIYKYSDPLSSMLKKMSSANKKFLRLIEGREKYNFIIVSFDKGDCEKYSFLYGPQYILDAPFERDGSLVVDTDVFFAGKDKGRIRQILDIEKMLNEMGLSTCFWLLGEKRNQYNDVEKDRLMTRSVPYKKIIQQDQKSKAILEVMQKGQRGLTYRPIEALHLRKKLITTFAEIKSYDFYNKNNIFVLGEDNLTHLKEFVNSPYVPIDLKIVEKYTFTGWVKEVYAKMGWDTSEIEKV